MTQPEQKTRNISFYCGIAMMGIGLLALGAASGIFYSQSNVAELTNNSTRSDVERLMSQVRERNLDTNVEKLLLNAETAVKGSTMSMGTARVSEEVEGLFVLDHTTGVLSCIVLNPRSGGDGIGLFTTNVREQLGGVKTGGADYLLATGFVNANLGGRAGTQRSATCVCYIADSNTGRIAAYSFKFNRTLLDNGKGQSGGLVPVWQGAAREPAAVRDE